MNIKLITQEIEKLNSIISAWNEGETVSTIECDLALNKLASLYELVRFGEQESPIEPIAPMVATPIVETTEDVEEEIEEEEEQEVEVEILFAEEDEEFGKVEINDTIEESEISTIAPIDEPKDKPTPIKEPVVTPEPEPEPESEPELAEEPIVAEPTTEPEHIIEITPAEEPTYIAEPAKEPEEEPQKPVEKPAEKPQRKPSMESLFGMEEIQRKPRSKHQRMMAIYSDPQQKPEKVVDISKIFDIDDDEDFEISVSSNTPTTEEHIVSTTVNDISTNESTVLADTIAPATTTLADTIVAPAPLAEELTSARTTSLRKAIGLNDKFLMTRDLFDGDSEAFEEAIAALDECESLDDCMIYIVENYEWNPDSEGAKFIMQLLERKHS